MLQSVLQAVFRLGRRDVDDEPDVHVHLHLHAGERLVLRLRRLRQCGRDLARLQLLPPVRLLTVTATARPCPSMSAPPELPLTTEAVVSIIGTR